MGPKAWIPFVLRQLPGVAAFVYATILTISESSSVSPWQWPALIVVAVLMLAAIIWGATVEAKRGATSERRYLQALIRRGWKAFRKLEDLTRDAVGLWATTPEPKTQSREYVVARAMVQANFYPRHQDRVVHLLQDASEYVDVAPIFAKLHPGMSFEEIREVKDDLAQLLQVDLVNELRKVA